MFLKKFNQNLLINKFLLILISNLIKFIKNFEIIELASGNGFLTINLFNLINNYNFKLNIIEIDKKFFLFLKKKYYKNLNIFRKNFLSFNYYYILNNIFFKKKKLIIIGNLPYNLLLKFFLKIINFININYENFFLIKKNFFLKYFFFKKFFFINFFFFKSFFLIKKLIKIKNTYFFPIPINKIISYLIKIKKLNLFIINFKLKYFFKKYLKIFKYFLKKYFNLKFIINRFNFLIKFFYFLKNFFWI